jgi:hypothetical protein
MRRPLLAILIVLLIAAAGYATARVRRDFWDFEVYRQAGARALAAEPLYRASDGHYQFKYWPAFALAMAPFAVIHPEAGKVVWYALSIALVALFIRRSIDALPARRSSRSFLAWWTILLTGKFVVKELVNGQTNALLGVLVVLALVAVQTNRRVTAGVLIGMAAFVKPYALLLLPWLAAAEGLTAAVATLAVLVAGWLLPAAVYGWQGNLTLLVQWYQTVVGTTPANLLLAENISIATMWAKWVGPGSAASALAAVTVAACLAAAVVAWRARRRVGAPAFLEAAYLLLLIPLISPQGWDYVLLLGIPAFVSVVDRFRGSPPLWQAVTVVGFALTSFTIYDLLGRSLYLSLMAASVVTVGALLIAASLIRLRLTAAA